LGENALLIFVWVIFHRRRSILSNRENVAREAGNLNRRRCSGRSGNAEQPEVDQAHGE
jgi:hypothetical protein